MRLLATLLVCASLAQATTYHVKTPGAGSQDGSNEANAFATIQAGVNAATSAGDIVLIHVGTYPEKVSSAASGSAGNVITIKGDWPELVTITGPASATEVAYEARCLSITHNYVTVKYVTVTDSRYDDNITMRWYWGAMSGANNTFTRVRFVQPDAVPQSVLTGWYWNDGSRLFHPYGTYMTIDSCFFRGGIEGMVLDGNTLPRYYVLRADTFRNTCLNNLIIGSPSSLGDQAGLIEACQFDTAGEDNIQFQNYGSTGSNAWNAGVLIRNNVFSKARENCLDMKGTTATVTVEGNYIINSQGNNTDEGKPDVPDLGGGGGIEVGYLDITSFAIIRHNIIWANRTGVKNYSGYHNYNNTYGFNFNSYAGYTPSIGNAAGVYTDGHAGMPAGNYESIINNIFFGNSLAGGSSTNSEVSIYKNNGGNFDMDYNCYYTPSGTMRFTTNEIGSPTPYHVYGLTAWKTLLDGTAAPYNFSGWDGHEDNSIADNPDFTSAPTTPAEYDSDWDFSLAVGSPCLGTGRWLTKTNTSGTNTVIGVEDAYFFRDDYGIGTFISGVVGDSIEIEDLATIVKVTGVDYVANLLTVAPSVTFASGKKVWLYRGGARIDDIGAILTQSGGAPPPPPPPPPPPDPETVYISWNKVMHEVTPTVPTTYEFSNLQRRDVDVVVHNAAGQAITWDTDITWITKAPAATQSGNLWCKFTRVGAVVYGAVMGATVSGTSNVTWGEISGDLKTQADLWTQLKALEARIAVLEGSNPPPPSDFAVNAVTSSKGTGTSLTYAHTTGGSDRMLVVSVAVTWEGITGVTYAGSAMTLIESRAQSGWTSAVYALANPTIGANDVVVTPTASASVLSAAISFANADQTLPANFAEADGTSTAPAVTTTSAVGDIVVNCVSFNANAGATTATLNAGDTERYNSYQGSYGGLLVSTTAGAASVAASWTLSASADWASVSVSVKPK